MSRLALVVAIATGLLMAACASQGADGSSTGLTAIDPVEYQGRLLYLDRSVDHAPLTAEELGDTERAIPVEIGVHGDFLVAWWAPDGVGRIGDPASVVTAWRIFDSAEPIDRDTSDEEGGEHTTPPAVAPPIDLPEGIDQTRTRDVRLQTRPQFFVDWIEEYTEEWMIFWGWHPGCI